MALLPLADIILDTPPKEDPIPNNQDIPQDEMDIFFRNEDEFLPEGKTWDELTDAEMALAKARYRFDPMRPGVYQGITGLGNMM